jgi:outer membrane protease
LSPSAGFLYRNRKWTAEDGYVQYPSTGVPWTDSVTKEKTAGVIISYEEEIWFPTISLGVSYMFSPRFETALTASWYPYLHIETIDSHFLRKTAFYDTMKGGMGVYAELSLIYHPVSTESVNFVFSGGFEGIYPKRGTTSSGSIGYDTGLVAAATTEPKLTSNLGWFSMGVLIYPELIWKK